MYKQGGEEGAAGADQGAAGAENAAGDDEVTDVDFEEVEEEDKK